MQMQRVFIVISIVAACDYYRICSEVVKSDKLDPVVLAQEILSPSTRFARDDSEPGSAAGRGSHRGVEDPEAALEQFREIAVDLSADLPTEREIDRWAINSEVALSTVCKPSTS